MIGRRIVFKNRGHRVMTYVLRPLSGLAGVRKRGKSREVVKFAPDVSLLRQIALEFFRLTRKISLSSPLAGRPARKVLHETDGPGHHP